MDLGGKTGRGDSCEVSVSGHKTRACVIHVIRSRKETGTGPSMVTEEPHSKDDRHF